MKTSRSGTRKEAKPAARPASAAMKAQLVAAAAAAAALWAYSPALRGPFLFDDNMLPFATEGAAAPLAAWLRGVRPAVMFTYWLNVRLSGSDPFSYHLLSLLIHCAASGLAYLIVRRLLALAWPDEAGAPRNRLLAALAAGVFLLHPMQTEAVAYLAGRSESLSVMLAFAAYAAFLYRKREEVTWRRTFAIMALFGAALLAKEQTIALAGLLLLTDFWWNPGFSLRGALRNWRLYGLMGAGAAAAVAMLWRQITLSASAGFGLRDITWYQYFFTQCRALFVYIAKFVLPVNLNADWDFPISKNVLDHGAIAGLVALVALAIAAWLCRRRFPLASFGFFVYLVLMAPTSSILPIKDPLAERRLYFSMLGLLLIAVDAARRIRISPTALAAAGVALLLAAAGATHARARVWSDPVLLWQDIVAKSPAKIRGHSQLAFEHFKQGSYAQAIAEFDKAAQLAPPTQDLLVNEALAYDAMGESRQAIEKMRAATRLPPPPNVSAAHVYTQLAMLYAKRSEWGLSLEQLDLAEHLDAGVPETYLYRGKIYFNTGRLAEAAEQYRRALAINPTLENARQDLALTEARLRGAR